MSKLKKLEKKIRDLCPELMELSFGCKVKIYNPYKPKMGSLYGIYVGAILEKSTHYIEFEGFVLEVPLPHSVVIGHPITLEACREAVKRLLEKNEWDDYESIKSYTLELNDCWENFQPWKKQTKVHELLYEIFNIK